MYLKIIISLIYLCLPTNVSSKFCYTPTNTTGLCINNYDCTAFNNQTNGYLNSLICSSSESTEIKVCCADDQQRINVTQYPASIATRSYCGVMDAQFRITNGVHTNIDDFPWMALLKYEFIEDGEEEFACGGSLIGNRYVLTAAHCVFGKILEDLKLIGVRLGEYDYENKITERDRQQIDIDLYQYADYPIDVGIEQVISHAFYNPYQKNSSNDIALIRLDKDISYSRYISPICLPTLKDFSEVGQQIFVAGWGLDSRGEPSFIKQQVRVPIVSWKKCRKTYKKVGNILRSQICAGGVLGKDICNGDSGGPLMSILDHTNQWYIEGIISYGNDKCGTKTPSVYTKVSSFLNWIHDNVY